MKKLIPLIAFLFLLGCAQEKGCTYVEAENFDPTAEADDGSCIFDTYSSGSGGSGSGSSGYGGTGGTGGTGGSGGGTSTGSVIFYTTTDQGCGNVYVEVYGEGTKTITHYVSYTPDCGNSYGATFSGLEPGSYSYYAECGTYYWESSFTITSGGCLSYKLSY